MNKKTIGYVIFGIVVFLYAAHATIITFSNPALTRTQVFLQTWGWFIPIIGIGVILAIMDYPSKKK